ncbi:hypothetical protein FRC03_000277 [Tulasnella sp. 419]|nr:hypothetical protein FRC03_000277 [Tulasnella sp. 419]
MSDINEPYDDVALRALNLMVQGIGKAEEESHHSFTGELESLDRRIQSIHTALARIDKVAKGQLADYHRNRNRLVSTILRLPNEIISETFIHLIHSIPLLTHRSNYFEALCHLRQVCSRFQSIADGTPKLWARVYGLGPLERDLSRSTIFLEKSKGALLDICIHIVGNRNSQDSLALLNRLLEQSHRWHTFRCKFLHPVSGKNNMALSSLSRLVPLQAQHLQEFVITNGPNDPVLSEAQVDLFGGVSPSLQHLDIMSMLIPWSSPLLSGLTFLRLNAWDGVRSPTSEKYVRMLTSCPGLKELHLSGKDGDVEDEGSDATFHCSIPLSELRTFSLQFIHPTTIESLLSSIKATPISLEIIFPANRAHEWEEVIDTALLGPNTSHVLDRFISSPHTVRLLRDEPLLALTTTDEGVPCDFTCDFQGSSMALILYRALFQQSATAKIQKLTLDCEMDFLRGDFHDAQSSYNDLLEELVQLRELELIDFEGCVQALLSPLADHIGPGEDDWGFPRVKMLKLKEINFDILELWSFVSRRYGNSPIAYPLKLVVEKNHYYDHPYEIPIDTATDIAEVLGYENFIWDGCIVGNRFESGWQTL